VSCLPNRLVANNRIRRILSQIEGKDIPKDELLSLDAVESIRMGTTVSTNALLERKGEKCALVTSKGWGDVLLIGMQGELCSCALVRHSLTTARPDIFDLSISKLAFLYDEVVEVSQLGARGRPAADPRSTNGLLRSNHLYPLRYLFPSPIR